MFGSSLKSIKIKIPLFILCVLVVVAASLWQGVSMLQESALMDGFKRDSASYSGAFAQIKLNMTEKMGIYTAQIISRDRDLKDALVSGDADEIEDNAVPDYNRLQFALPDISELTYFSAEGKVIRRENSSAKGDSPQREMLARSMKDNKVVSGIDQGEEGIRLFQVTPIVHKGNLIAFLEVGMKFDSMLNQLKDFSNAKSVEIKFEKMPDEPIRIQEDPESNEQTLSLTIQVADISKKVVGYVEVKRDISGEIAQHSKNKLLFGGVIAVFFLVINGILYFLVRLYVLKPLDGLSISVKEFGERNLTVQFHENEDEIGKVGSEMNQALRKVNNTFHSVYETTYQLNSASNKLSDVSSQLAGSSEQMAQQVNTVAGATEEMSVSINSMASGIEEANVNSSSVSNTAEKMSANMSTIASAIEEMTVSIGNVSKNTEETAKVTIEATTLSSKATETMKKLGVSATEIGNVTEMIKRIAEQTNLLALNATIEAASAGEAGKGFAVVANEIKELASQSAHAADDIASKIEGVQSSTDNAVGVISDVSNIIGKINESVESITKTLSQQTLTANEISSNISEVSRGASNIATAISEVARGSNDISKNAGDAAKAANDVSENVLGISKAVDENNTVIHQIDVSTKHLAEIAKELQAYVDEFRIDDSDGQTKKGEGKPDSGAVNSDAHQQEPAKASKE